MTDSRRLDDGAEKMRRRKMRVAEGVESAVEGFLRFLQRFASTTLRILFKPHRALRALLRDRLQESPSFVLPLTYLAIGIFLLSLVAHIAGLNVLNWIWFADEIGGKVTDALRIEVSLASIVVQAAPGMAAVLVLVLVQRWLPHWWPAIDSQCIPWMSRCLVPTNTRAFMIARRVSVSQRLNDFFEMP